ncbi:MAG: hypothetical protein ACREJ2_16745 [Planctomycetota bacterium]
MPARGEYREMPPEVRRLADPWPSLTATVPGLTPALESDFRFGKRVVRFGPEEFRMGGSLKGGASTMWFPTDQAHFDIYRRWNELEGFAERADPTGAQLLHDLLAAHHIELAEPTGQQDPAAFRDRHGPLYRMVWEILRRLPSEHLTGARFARLQLGGGGPDNAKGSAFDAGAVIMYSFAIDGARRTFYGLFLHELGHLSATAFSAAALAHLNEAHAVLRRHAAFLGVEFLLGAESREQYQAWPTSEFLAETYLHYTACGSRLRAFLHERPQPEVRAAWARVYEIFLDRFGGLEYL